MGFAEADRGWLSAAAEGRQVRVFIDYDDPVIQSGLLEANAADAFADLPRAVLGNGVPPGEDGPPSEPVAHWVSERRNGEQLAARTAECRGDFVSAARAAIVLLGAAEGGYGPSAPGVADVEEAFTLDDVRTGLALAGIDIVRQPMTASQVKGLA